jgi:hypothetical protein
MRSIRYRSCYCSHSAVAAGAKERELQKWLSAQNWERLAPKASLSVNVALLSTRS